MIWKMMKFIHVTTFFTYVPQEEVQFETLLQILMHFITQFNIILPREDVKVDFNQQWTSFCFEQSTVTCNAKKINEFLTLKKPRGSVISGRGWLDQSKDIYRKLLAVLV